MKYWLFYCMLACSLFSSCGEKEIVFLPKYAPYQQVEAVWVDSILGTLSINEKIGQLLIVEETDTSKQTLQQLLHKAERQTISGWQTNFSDVGRYAFWIDTLQTQTRFPLFIRQTSAFDFHTYSDTILNAISSKTIVQNWKKQHAFFQQALGVNFDATMAYHPNRVVDANLNQKAIAKYRNDGKKQTVQYLQNLQKDTLLAGIRDYGTFVQIPNDTLGIVDSLLRPYRTLVRTGLSSIQIADSVFASPYLAMRPPRFIQDYFEQQLKFNGLIVSNYINKEVLHTQFNAGVTLFTVPLQAHLTVFKHIESLLESEKITAEALDEKVRKILLAKYWLKAKTPLSFPKDTIQTIQNSPSYAYLHRQIKEQSIVLATHKNQLLPFKKIAENNPFWLNIGTPLSNIKKNYERYDEVLMKQISASTRINTAAYSSYNPLIISLNDVLFQEKDSLLIGALQELGQQQNVVIINLKNSNNLCCFNAAQAVIQTYDNDEVTQDLLTQLLHGGLRADGRLPFHVNDEYAYLQKAERTPITRLKYTMPEEVGAATVALKDIDYIVRQAINKKAAPGCQVMAIKNGKVFFNKVYGHHTYNKRLTVLPNDMYDVASITKVTATTFAAMKLQEEGKLDLEKALKAYLNDLDTATIKNITLKELFIHQSGLQANMPIKRFLNYKDTIRYGTHDYFAKKENPPFEVPIARDFYLRKDWLDTLWTTMKNLPLEYKGRYKYSDINMNIAQKVLENLIDSNLQKYTAAAFYDPLNLKHTTYNPLEKVRKIDIVPTEVDNKWREQLVHGYVHDESAALLGGIGGNAGLFSNTKDLAILYQMLLNGGIYGEERYFNKATVQYFTSATHGNHRGIGFNKPYTNRRTPACSSSASYATFGHTGFTGCCVWVDPVNDLIYIFLSNRVYPQRNNRLSKLKTRRRIHDVLYRALN